MWVSDALACLPYSLNNVKKQSKFSPCSLQPLIFGVAFLAFGLLIFDVMDFIPL